MTVGVILPPVHNLVADGRCSGCRAFPCVCRIDRSTRIEPCACGGRIMVVDRSVAPAIMAAVSFHNRSDGHRHWATALGLR